MKRMSPTLSNFVNHDKRRELLKFFQVATEREMINRYPCLGETLAHDIIEKRRNLQLKRLRDVWNLGRIRDVLLADCVIPTDDMIEMDPVVINENRPKPPSTAAGGDFSNRSTAFSRDISRPPLLEPPQDDDTSTVIPSAIRPQMPPIDYSVLELLQVLESAGLVRLWKEYIIKDEVLSVTDALPSGTYRIATWNIDRLTTTKAKHPGIREAICLTLLANQFDVIALQEVVDPEAIQLLVEELNSPSLPMLKRWMAVNASKGGRFAGFASKERTGRTFQAVEYSAFIYRSDRLEAVSSRIFDHVSGDEKHFTRAPFMSKFKLGGYTLILTSVHLKAPALHQTQSEKNFEEVATLCHFVDAMEDTLKDNAHYVILGDFNLDPGHGAFDPLRSRGLTSALPSACATMATAVDRGAGIGSKSTGGIPSLDNAWLCPRLIAKKASEDAVETAQPSGLKFAGVAAVVKAPRHPLIPSPDLSMETSGCPSDHCPVYFDLRDYSKVL